jgi:hypothetical protein
VRGVVARRPAALGPRPGRRTRRSLLSRSRCRTLSSETGFRIRTVVPTARFGTGMRAVKPLSTAVFFGPARARGHLVTRTSAS